MFRQFTQYNIQSPGWQTKLLVFLYAFGLVIRLGAVFTYSLDRELGFDEEEYVFAAINLAEGRGYALVPQGLSGESEPQLTAFRMPGPSIVQSVFIRMFGERSVKILAVFLASFSIPLMYLLTKQICRFQPGRPPEDEHYGHTIALTSAVVCAIYPLWIFHSITAMSEPYSIPAFLFAHRFIAHRTRNPTPKGALQSGLVWGLSCYIKPHGVPMTAFNSVQLWMKNSLRLNVRSLLPSVLIVLGVVIALSPWIWRNYRVFDRFIPLATEGSESLYGSNNPYVYNEKSLRGRWISPVEHDGLRKPLEGTYGELERNDLRQKLVKEYWNKHPDHFFWMAYWKVQGLLSPISTGGVFRTIYYVCTWGLLATLFVLGLIRRTFRWSVELQLVCLWIAMQCVVAAVYGSAFSRDRLPMEVLLIPWAVISVFDLLRIKQATSGKSASATRAAIANPASGS